MHNGSIKVSHFDVVSPFVSTAHKLMISELSEPGSGVFYLQGTTKERVRFNKLLMA